MNPFAKHEKGNSTPRLLLIIAVVIGVAVFLYWSRHSGKGKNDRVETPSGRSAGAALFTLPDVNGNEFYSSELAGKPVVINFFTTWCPTCRDEIPGLVEMYEKYKHNGFELIGISIGEAPETLSSFMNAHGIRYKILIGDMKTVRAYGDFRAVPTTFFIDRNWKIKKIIKGYISRETLESEILELL